MTLQRIFKKEEISWAALALEVFSVTLSVLVALAIGDWHEERQQRKQAEQALQGIAAECESNQRNLERRLAYYTTVRDGLQRKIEAQGADAPALPVKGWKGLYPVLLRNSAYRTAVATDAFSHMEFSLADAISRIYALHEFYVLFLDKTLDQMLAGRLQSAGALQNMMQELISITQDGIDSEAELSALIHKKMGSPKT